MNNIKSSIRKTILIYVRVIIISVLFCNTSLLIAQDNYFVSVNSNPGSMSVDSTTGNIAIADDVGISIYSSVNFSLLQEIDGIGGSSFNKFTNYGLYIFTSVRFFERPPAESGQLAIIRLSDENIQLVDIDRYPFGFDIPLAGNYVYMVGGLHGDNGINMYKINTATLNIDNQAFCGRGSHPKVILNHDNTKVYVINQSREMDFSIVNEDYLEPDFSTEHNNIWVFDTQNLSLLSKIRVDFKAQDLIRGETGQIIVSHNPPELPENASITILDSINDEVISTFHFDDIGFVEIEYDPTINAIYGSVFIAVWINEYDYNFEYVNFLGKVDLDTGTLICIPVGSEKVGPSFALSPNGSRAYVTSCESNKIYYVDM